MDPYDEASKPANGIMIDYHIDNHRPFEVMSNFDKYPWIEPGHRAINRLKKSLKSAQHLSDQGDCELCGSTEFAPGAIPVVLEAYYLPLYGYKEGIGELIVDLKDEFRIEVTFIDLVRHWKLHIGHSIDEV